MAYFKCPNTIPKVYGVEWSGSSSPLWTRTDDAEDFQDPIAYYSGMSEMPGSPFDDISPWKDMEVIEDSEAGSLVKIPKFYYKWTRSGSSMKLQISTNQEEDFLVSPAHADRGDGNGEREEVYVGRYHCATSTYKSTSGVMPVYSVSKSTCRTNISNLATDIWQWDYAMVWTIRMLYLVEYANWNSQTTIGSGCSAGTAKFNMGATDSMPYHTGTTGTSRSAYSSVQYRNIEGLWDNVMDWVDGIYFSSTSVYCIKNPASFADSSGGTLVGTRASSSGCISAWTDPSSIDGFEYALYPSAISGTDYTLYVGDRAYYYSSYNGLTIGGPYSNSNQYGLFYAYSSSATATNNGVGSRLMKLPNAA